MCRVAVFENWWRTLRPPRSACIQQELRPTSLNKFSPESKQMIEDMGNIELCEVLETEPKTQCKACSSYWDIGIFYCTCGHFLRKRRGANQKFINYTMDVFKSLNIVKKWRLHGPNYGKKPGDNIISNTMPLRHRSDWSRSCLLCSDYHKQEKNHMCLLIPMSTNNGRHAVHLLYGWIGKVCGGLFIPKVMTEMRQILGERSTCYLQYLASFSDNVFEEFNLFCCRWRSCEIR